MNVNKGISLIILIITIMVLIIISGTIIFSLNNTNIISNVNNAVNLQNKSNIVDAYNLLIIEMILNKELQNDENIKLNNEELADRVGVSKVELNKKFKIDGNGNLIENNGDNNWEVIVKSPFKIFTRDKGESNYYMPYIPNDFKYVEGTWDTGLVIKNISDNNEFVWIPVKKNFGNSEDQKFYYKKRDFDITETEVARVEEDFEYSLTKEQEIADNLVEKYGGFYIGRYEAGSNIRRLRRGEALVENLVIQPSKPVYNYVNYMQARELSNKLYFNKKDYISTLTSGKQWDTACMFLGREYANNSIDSKGNRLGNYSGDLVDTAFRKNYCIKNVYDMAGNCYEWTNEKVKESSFRIVRGGNYDYKRAISPAGYRYGDLTGACFKSYTFRVSMYIK